MEKLAGVTLGSDGRVFLGDNAFYQPGNILSQLWYKAGDLPGIIVHEFFHRAGLTEAQVKTLNADIQKKLWQSSRCALKGRFDA